MDGNTKGKLVRNRTEFSLKILIFLMLATFGAKGSLRLCNKIRRAVNICCLIIASLFFMFYLFCIIQKRELLYCLKTQDLFSRSFMVLGNFYWSLLRSYRRL